MQKKFDREKVIREAFDIGVLLKGVDGALEILGGILLYFIKPQTIDAIVRFFTTHELSEDTHDFIAVHLVQAAQHLTLSSQLFGAFYLLSHGIVKIIIVVGLLKEKLWAYHIGIIFLAASIIYQLYRYSINQSIAMLLLTLFDLVVVWLVWHEYRLKRSRV